jgi:hypothetical protein
VIAGIIAIILIAMIIFFLTISIDSLYSFDSRIVGEWIQGDYDAHWTFDRDGTLKIQDHGGLPRNYTWRTKGNQLHMFDVDFTYEFSDYGHTLTYSRSGFSTVLTELSYVGR